MDGKKRSSNSHAFDARQTGSLEVAKTKVRAFRLFTKVAEFWGLTERQKRKLLGSRSLKSDLLTASELFHGSGLRRNEVQILSNISKVLEIFLLCQRAFNSDKDAVRWLKEPCQDPLFCNVAPLTWMICGGAPGICQVKEYLQNRCEGDFAA